LTLGLLRSQEWKIQQVLAQRHFQIVNFRLAFEALDFHGDSFAIALLVDGTDHLVYAGMSQGVIGKRLLDAASFAEDALAKVVKDYEPRLLEIPALRIYLLWLFSRGDSRFVVLSDRGTLGSDELATTLQIESLIKSAATATRVERMRNASVRRSKVRP